MDKEDKAREWKHRSNKKKYGKNKPGGHTVPPSKPKKQLESNWDRYEQEEVENQVSSSTDFSVLANAPITRGSHFQFKSDKDIALEIAEPATASALFNLDLILLEKSLSTIPFYVRSGIQKEFFSENQHKIMEARDDKLRDYEGYLRGYQRKEADVVFGSEVGTSEESDPDEPDASPQGLSPRISGSPESAQAGDGDLEQWLDDILDD